MVNNLLFRDNASLTLLTLQPSRGYTPPVSTIFFITAKPLEVLRLNFDSVNKVLLGIILSQDHTPLQCLHRWKWLILKLDQTLQTNYLAFWNSFLVSGLETCYDLDWWRQFLFLLTSSKIHFWSVNYTPVMWLSQWPHLLSSFNKGCPWYKFQLHTMSET